MACDVCFMQVDFWTTPAKDRAVDVHVDPSLEKAFFERIDNSGIKHQVLIEDIQKSVLVLIT